MNAINCAVKRLLFDIILHHKDARSNKNKTAPDGQDSFNVFSLITLFMAESSVYVTGDLFLAVSFENPSYYTFIYNLLSFIMLVSSPREFCRRKLVLISFRQQNTP